MVLMGIIKVTVPEELDETFRKAASRRIGVQRGALTTATLAAMSKYSGEDPKIALIASEGFVSIEAPSNQMPGVLSALLPRIPLSISTPHDVENVKKRLGEVKVIYSAPNYTVFECQLTDPGLLADLGSFRAEWDEKELILEEDCLSLTTASLEEALGIAKKMAPILGLGLPHIGVGKQLEIYQWKGVKGQEVILK